jgi:hypothetical protein
MAPAAEPALAFDDDGLRRQYAAAEPLARAGADDLHLQSEEASKMNRWKRVVARRQRKAHSRYLAERARQQALAGQDTQDEVRKTAFWSYKGQQGMGPGGGG